MKKRLLQTALLLSCHFIAIPGGLCSKQEPNLKEIQRRDLHNAIDQNNEHIIIEHIQKNLAPDDLEHLLHYAITKSNLPVAKLLLEAKASPNKKTMAISPLHAAVYNEKSYELLHLLANYGASLEADYKGYTPFEKAVIEGNLDATKFFLTTPLPYQPELKKASYQRTITLLITFKQLSIPKDISYEVLSFLPEDAALAFPFLSGAFFERSYKTYMLNYADALCNKRIPDRTNPSAITNTFIYLLMQKKFKSLIINNKQELYFSQVKDLVNPSHNHERQRLINAQAQELKKRAKDKPL